MKGMSWLIIAGIAGAGAVAAAAWSAHGLAGNPTAQAWAETASRLQLTHAVALLAIGGVLHGRSLFTLPRYCLHAAATLFTIGMVLFCGSLYTLAFAGSALFPGSAPMGGSSLIIGWLAIAAAGWSSLRDDG